MSWLLLDVLFGHLLCARAQDAAQGPALYQTHASGTSNPAPLFWNVMDTLQTRTKPAALMTYRSVGSGSGQIDLNTSANVSKSDFSCGDYPLSTQMWQDAQDNNNSVLHIPLFVGTISIFAKIPGVSEAVKLPPCPLVKIFSGDITSWNDPEIQDENPGLSLPEEQITVVHRAPGSSSTNAFTTYLREASIDAGCSSPWPEEEVGSTVNETQWAQKKEDATNSQEIIDKLLGLQSAIGYLESGQGIANGLNEVQLRNKAGTYLRHNDDTTTIVSDSVLDQSFPKGDNNVLEDWSNVSLINREGETTWPLALISYCYCRQDLTFLGRNSGLTKFVLKHLLSDEVSALASQRYGFTPLTESKRESFRDRLEDELQVVADTEWTLETETNDQIGQTDRVVSIHRESFTLRAIEDGMTQVARFYAADARQDARMSAIEGEIEEQKAASAPGIYQTHGSGTSNPAPLFWNVMKTLQTRTKPAALMTYRSVGSGSGQTDLDTSANVSKSDFSCGDYPLSTEKWQASQDNNRVLHIPLFVGTISIFAKIPGISEAVKLSPCPLVKIFRGDITSWNDPEIRDENPGLSLPERPITVVHRAPGSSSTNAFTTYLREASLSAECASPWPSDEVGSAVSQSQWAQDKKEVLNSQQMIDELLELQSAIGYLESGQGITNGLSEVQLKNKAGTYLRHNDDKTTIVSDDVLNESFPEGDDVLADWSSVSLINRGGDTTWPLALVSYCYARQDLTFLGRNSGLTKFVLSYMLSDEVSQLAKERYGFTPLTKNKRDGFQTQLNSLLEVQGGTEWTLETETDDNIGQSDRVVSIHRESYVLRAIEDEMSQIGGFLRADGSQDARIRVLEKEVEDQKNKADKALDVAIAGLVIGLVLGLIGASLGFVALKRAGSGKGGMYSDHLRASTASENPTFSSY